MNPFQQPAPGSKRAKTKGCVCPAKINNNGQGQATEIAKRFYIKLHCPLHGINIKTL